MAKNLPQRIRAKARRGRGGYTRLGKRPYLYPAWCVYNHKEDRWGGDTPFNVRQGLRQARFAAFPDSREFRAKLD